jgi:hypothetical protein
VKIALVRHVRDASRGPSDQELGEVAQALQQQVVGDVAPIWGVSGVVTAFPEARQVPAGYLPVIVVGAEDLPTKRRTFHTLAGGVPAALVAYDDQWSVAASHELIEMLCDPSGMRTIPGPSLHAEQGLVEYLMEVCDPCEGSDYAIGSVRVSDFVTPQYYGLPSDSGNRYSFLGRLTSPLDLHEGGYITWRTEEGDVFQAFASGSGKPEIKPLEERPLALSRQWIDAHPKGIQRPPDAPQDPSTPVDLPPFGEALDAEVGLRLDNPRFWREVNSNPDAQAFLGWLPHR